MAKRGQVQPSRERADDGWYENVPEEVFEQALQALMGCWWRRYLDNLS